MNELAKSVTNYSVQSQVRRVMRNISAFELDIELPEPIQSKLDELDRAMIEHMKRNGAG